MNNSISSLLTGCAFVAAVVVLITLPSCATSEWDSRLPFQEGGSWEDQRAQREKAHAAYLKDATIRTIATDDASRPPWYSSQLGYNRYDTQPLGFNGIPYVLLRAVIEVYPEIWKGEGSLGNLGFGPHPDDYDPATGKLLPAEQRNPLPYGLFYAEDPLVEEGKRTENVFFSCGACHTGRVYVKDRVRHLVGAPNTEIEAQGYAGLIYDTGNKLQADPDQVHKIFSFLDAKVKTDPAWFYGGRTPAKRSANIERAKIQVGRVLANREDMIKVLIGTAGKTKKMYIDLASTLSYIDKDGQKSPGVFGPRPGRMDAFGIVAGLVVLHAARPDFLARLPDNHTFLDCLESLPRGEMSKQADDRLVRDACKWMPHDPGASDIKSLWLSRDSKHANWDANQQASARVLSSGVSAVGDPFKVNVRALEAMAPFIDNLPPPPYPFEVDLQLAAKGKPLFQKDCAGCHNRDSKEIVHINVGTDMNRAKQISKEARLGLLALTREACEHYMEQKDASNWCKPKGTDLEADEAYFATPRGEKSGYKATVLHGIWARAPYLHNGSVPTLWHLLRPAERPEKFIRGNIKYDEKNIGFVWDKKPGPDEYGQGDTVHFAEYDTTLRGNSKEGHLYGREWSDGQVRAVIEYMKTL